MTGRARMKDPYGAQPWDGQGVADSSYSSTSNTFAVSYSLVSGTGRESAISLSPPPVQYALTFRAQYHPPAPIALDCLWLTFIPSDNLGAKGS